MSRLHKKICTTLNCIKHVLSVTFTISWCIIIAAFVSLFGVPILITSFSIRLKICSIAAGIEMYMLIINKKETWENSQQILNSIA